MAKSKIKLYRMAGSLELLPGFSKTDALERVGYSRRYLPFTELATQEDINLWDANFGAGSAQKLIEEIEPTQTKRDIRFISNFQLSDIKITTEKRGDEYYVAYLTHNKARWEAGGTKEHAIGKLFISLSKSIQVDHKVKNSKRHPIIL